MSPDEEWERPGPHDLGDGVHRIPLPMPAGGLRAVNVYAVLSTDGVTMVDAGWATAGSEAELERALGELGVRLTDIRRFLITHAHRDHYSLAVALRDRLGIPASMGRGERESLAVLASTNAAERARRLGCRLVHSGAAELAAVLGARPRYRDEDILAYGDDPDDWLDDLRDVGCGLRAIATPGHTRGHMVYQSESRRIYFTGDHVLPRITPSVGSEPAPPELPLRDYLESLARMRMLPDGRLLPAHGAVHQSVHQRVDELLLHHDERLAETLAAVQAGDSTAFEAARRLRWTRHRRDLDELAPSDQGMAVMETAAHLDVLALRGEVVRKEGGVVHYVMENAHG